LMVWPGRYPIAQPRGTLAIYLLAYFWRARGLGQDAVCGSVAWLGVAGGCRPLGARSWAG